jgi:xylose isomerase
MSHPVKCALITAFVSKTKDRFHDYNRALELDERLALVAKMQGMSGVEVIFPYETKDAAHLKGLLAKYRLEMAAVNVNVKAEPEFRTGGLTSTDPAIRKRAVQFIKDSKDFAQAVGANKVTCCPLGDGYEFGFQCDYAQMWKYLVETFGEAGSYKPEIGIAQMGTTIDFGHSKYGGENPAEVVSMLAHSRFPYYVHINDNNGKWDWDFMVASHNFLEYAEFLFYLQEYGYTDFLTSDTSPTRWDIVGTFEANTRMTQKVWDRLLSLDRDEFWRLIRGGDFLKTWQFIEANILKL